MTILGLLFQTPNLFPAILAVTLVSVGIYLKLTSPLRGKRLPPGSLGLPIIGESLDFFQAQKADKNVEWIKQRVAKYGPVFKTSLMGSPVIVLTGQAANRFIFNANENTIGSNSIATVANVLGKHSIFELTGDRYKLVRRAMMVFLQPEMLQRFASDLDSVVRRQVMLGFQGKETVRVVPLMKKMTFNVTCSLLFGLPEGAHKDAFFKDFSIALKGMWALPVDFPGTAFRRSSQARARICRVLTKLIEKRREEIRGGKRGLKEDVISCFLSFRGEKGEGMIEEEIIDNLIVMMMASHDTSAILLTFLLRLLARDAAVYDKVLLGW